MPRIIANRVIEIVAEQYGYARDQISLENSLRDLNGDSIDEVELVMELEEEFNLRIPDADALVWRTVADIVSYLESYVW